MSANMQQVENPILNYRLLNHSPLSLYRVGNNRRCRRDWSHQFLLRPDSVYEKERQATAFRYRMDKKCRPVR